jgi:hypothetical protein
LQLRLRLSQFGVRLAFGNDAPACKKACAQAVSADLSASDSHRKGPVPVSIEPPHGTAIATAVHTFVTLDEGEGWRSGCATKGGSRSEHPDAVKNV